MVVAGRELMLVERRHGHHLFSGRASTHETTADRPVRRSRETVANRGGDVELVALLDGVCFRPRSSTRTE
jgi:hypothetical protein